MSKRFAIWLVLFPAIMSAQEKLRGRVITDQFKLEESITVKNTTTDISTETDREGNFTIPARANDTLTFTAGMYKPVTLVLKAADFEEELLVVRAESVATMLEEVIVAGLTGNLAVDSKRLKTMQVNTWFDAAEINKNVIVNSGIQGANWIAGFASFFRKPTPPKRATAYLAKNEPEQKLFSEVVRSVYPARFFSEDLHIHARFTGAFLAFCDEDAKRYLLLPQNEKELTDYLKNKSIEFLKLNPDAR